PVTASLIASPGGGRSLPVFFLTAHSCWMIPLQSVNAEGLVLLFRVADPSRFSKGLDFDALHSMANKLIRIYGRGHLHFITFSCYRRVPFPRSVRAKNVFAQILNQVRDRHGFALVGYVVMPEHVRLLIGEPAKGTPSTVVQVLKQRVSRRLRRKKQARAAQLSLAFARGECPLPRFWQRRFYDFTGAGSTWSPPERCVELEEESREAALHAHESAKEKIGRSSEGLALEQLFVLLKSQTRIDPRRSRPFSPKNHRKSQTHRPFEIREGAAPRKRKPAGKRAPPAEAALDHQPNFSANWISLPWVVVKVRTPAVPSGAPVPSNMSVLP